jgi:Fe-S oxidoreductase
VTVFDLLIEYIRSGRIVLDKSRNTGLATYHDPCNYGRKSLEMFGRAFFEEGRWIMDQCWDNWVDAYPSAGNQYCCGGGGGTMLTPFTDQRLYHGARKLDQIRRTGADTLVVPCHSCHGQIKALAANENMDLTVKYLWEAVADSLVVE